jgi:hypothetical protein
MDNTDLALTAVALAAGIIAGFVLWTYVGPMIAGTAAAPTAA